MIKNNEIINPEIIKFRDFIMKISINYFSLFCGSSDRNKDDDLQ